MWGLRRDREGGRVALSEMRRGLGMVNHMTKTLGDFLESPPEMRGHILLVHIPPRKRRVRLVPVHSATTQEKEELSGDVNK